MKKTIFIIFFLLIFFSQLKIVISKEEDYSFKSAFIPSDTHFHKQWYLVKTKTDQAWDKVREAPDVVIAVIDSGVQIDHPDLKDNIWINKKEIPNNGFDDDQNGFVDDINGWDFIHNTADPSPKFFDKFSEAGVIHGTVIAGIIAGVGNNKIGISGITWKAQIMPLKVLNNKGEGRLLEVVKAIDYAINNGAHIINLSFIGTGYSKYMEDAIRRAYQAGIIIVAAAGNDQEEGDGYDLDKKPLYPVCYDGGYGENMIIGVSATDAVDQKTVFSGFGSRCIDISAPGVSIFSTVTYNPSASINGKYFQEYYGGFWSGTSMATPIVSGGIALIMAANPDLNRREIINILLQNTDNIDRLNPNYKGKLGQGRINILLAVEKALSYLKNKVVKIISSSFSDDSGRINISDQKGIFEKSFFAYGKNFRGGVNVATGDMDGDGKDEIITGAGLGGGPQVRIFSSKGNVLGQFFAYNKRFRGGVNVATGDISRLGRISEKEIITAPGIGMTPLIKVFDLNGYNLAQFYAYDKKFTNGVNVAALDVDYDGYDEIITGAKAGGGPHVRVFKKDGGLFSSFYAFEQNYSGGVDVGGLIVK